MNSQNNPISSTIQTYTPSVTDIMKSANGRWQHILTNLGVAVVTPVTP